MKNVLGFKTGSTSSNNPWKNPLGFVGTWRSRRKRKKAEAARQREMAANEIRNAENDYGFTAGADGESLVDARFQDGGFRINASKTESQRRNRELADLGSTDALEALSQFDPATAGDRAEEAFRSQATDDFMQTYNPLVERMQNQIGNRFGSFNNTNFNDNWTKMNQQVLTPALTRISRDAIMNRGQYVQNEMNPILQLLNTYNVQVDNDIQDTLRKITMGSQGHAQGLDTMRTSPVYQDALRRAGWAAPIQQPAKRGIDWGQLTDIAKKFIPQQQDGGK